MRPLSVNVGRPRPNPWTGIGATAIDKRPADGPVAVAAPGPKGTGEVGLAGDRVYDVTHHGGPDQAVYAYAREELDRHRGSAQRQHRQGTRSGTQRARPRGQAIGMDSAQVKSRL